MFCSRSELDITETSDKYPANFMVGLSMKVTDEVPDHTYTEPWDKMRVEKLSPHVCFSTKEEYWECHEEFGKF